jgi:ABC-type nitrate/sulfonate/bicarbonate transport system ATPase subunit
VSSGMLRRVALVRTDVSEEFSLFLQEPHGVTSQKTAIFPKIVTLRK